MPPPVLTTDVARKPHKHDPDPLDTRRNAPCRQCKEARSYCAHQPSWWRFLFHNVKWR